MYSLADYIRKIGAETEYKIEGIKIFFSAPKPKSPSSETLDIKEEKSEGANFEWIAYQVLFLKGETYYIYNIDLGPNGQEKPPATVFESDSDWSGKKKSIPARDIIPGDIKRAFPRILKGPNLKPWKEAQTIYVNIDESDKGNTYSSEEFKRNFDNDFYIVLNPKSKKLVNPLGELIGMSYPKKEEKK